MFVIGIQVSLNEMWSNSKYMLNHTAITSEHSYNNPSGKFSVFLRTHFLSTRAGGLDFEK